MRDFFLLITMFMLLLSGYTFNLNNMDDSVVSLTKLNPMRWLFQGLMIWQYENLQDGVAYLDTYSYGNLHRDFVFEYLRNFYYFSGVIYLFMLLPAMSRLRRRPRGLDNHVHTAAERCENSEGGDDVSAGTSYIIHPQQFSLSGLVVSDNTPRGPDVRFSSLTYTYNEMSLSFSGIKNMNKKVLDRCSGIFKNGHINAIVGASGCGRSTLLHILAGSICPQTSNKQLSGSVWYGESPIDYSTPAWERSALVESKGVFIRDISVKDTIGYAWQLRCASMGRISIDSAAVDRILNLVQLAGKAKKKVKSLSIGEVI